MGRTPEFRVEFSVELGGGPPVLREGANSDVQIFETIQGSLEVRRPYYQRFSARWREFRYEFRQSEQGAISFFHEARQYKAYPPLPRLLPAPSDDGVLAEQAYPSILLSTNLSEAMPPENPFRLVGQEKVGEELADRLTASMMGPMGELNLTVWIAADGRLVRHRIDSSSIEGRRTTIFHFRRWTTGLPAARYTIEPIWGYSPRYFPIPAYPLEVGTPVPEASGVDAQGRSVDLRSALAGRMAVVLFTDPECEVTRRASGALASLAAEVSRRGGQTAEVWLGAQRPGARLFGSVRLADPKGEIERAIGVTATPMLIMIGQDGRVERLWKGYDPKQARAMIDGMFAPVRERE